MEPSSLCLPGRASLLSPVLRFTPMVASGSRSLLCTAEYYSVIRIYQRSVHPNNAYKNNASRMWMLQEVQPRVFCRFAYPLRSSACLRGGAGGRKSPGGGGAVGSAWLSTPCISAAPSPRCHRRACEAPWRHNSTRPHHILLASV